MLGCSVCCVLARAQAFKLLKLRPSERTKADARQRQQAQDRLFGSAVARNKSAREKTERQKGNRDKIVMRDGQVQRYATCKLVNTLLAAHTARATCHVPFARATPALNVGSALFLFERRVSFRVSFVP